MYMIDSKSMNVIATPNSQMDPEEKKKSKKSKKKEEGFCVVWSHQARQITIRHLFIHSIPYFFLPKTFVIACRMVVPAFSISFFVRPIVTQTLSAGGTICLGSKLSSRVLRRVIRTPLMAHCVLRLEIGYRKPEVDRIRDSEGGMGLRRYLIDHVLEQELLILS